MTLNDLGGRGTPAPHHPIRFADLCGHRLEYVDIPAHQLDRPPLIFMHEGLGSVAMWRDFPANLAAATGCRTIVYSRPGHGRSSPFRGPHTPRFMHEEALEVVPALRQLLGIEKPVFIGHSTGASMSLIHAGAGRWEVTGVVAMAPLCFVEPFNLESIRQARDVFSNTGMKQKLARYHDDAEAVFWSWNDIWLDPAFASWNIAADVAGIRCPVLAVLGEDDEYCTQLQIDAVLEFARNASSVEYLRLADCRHSPHRDQPEAVMAALIQFIDAAT